MTAEVFTARSERKFIPIFRSGPDWASAAPLWLAGKYRSRFAGTPLSRGAVFRFGEHSARHEIEGAELLFREERRLPLPLTTPEPFTWEPIRILHVIIDEVTVPRDDGTRGSALYRIPLQLSPQPDTHLWIELFIKAWDHPPKFTQPQCIDPASLASTGDRLDLDGTQHRGGRTRSSKHSGSRSEYRQLKNAGD